jgi:peptidase M28-like protein
MRAMTPRGKALLAFVVLAALVGLETCRLGNPDAAPADAPAAEFSATRAIATLHEVSLDVPHPLGTPAHDVVRDRIVAALRALDYRVEIEATFACNAAATCGHVDNIIARVPGQAPGPKAVAVAAHYDSVPAGPGASDDGTGVATALEIARAIRHEALANPVVFLIDDGEEAGLLGTEGFVADTSRSNDAALIINMEARGTTGTPFLFETSREQRWLLPVLARALPHPVTTSLFATIYDLLPNDTDLTVFKRARRAGINFAYLGGGTQYHTPLDNFANVDAGSVQRRGEQVLAMVRAFGATSLEDAAPGDAVWFDVFAAVVVWWPAGWSVWITALALVLVAVAIVRGARRGAVTLVGVVLGAASFVATLVLAVGLGVGLARLLGLRAPGALFVPHPGPMVAAAGALGLAAALAVAALIRRRASFDAVVLGHAVVWNALAVVVAMVLPGAAYVFVVPGAVMAVLAVLRATVRLGEVIASLGALAAAAMVVLPFVLTGYDALGEATVAATVIMAALVGTTFAPLVVETARRLVPGCIALAVVLGVIAAVVPNRSVTHPWQLALAHVTEADTGAARWQADRPTPGVRAAVRFEPSKRLVAPWYGPAGVAEVAPAPAVAIEPPGVTVAATALAGDGTRVITLDVASVRHAPRLAVTWHSDAEVVALRINGVTPPPRPPRFHSYLAPGWHRILVRGSSAHVEITVRGTAPAEAIVADSSFGLPAVAAPLITARDASGAVPVHDGDVTVVERHVTW